LPCCSTRAVSSRATRRPEIEVSTTAARHSFVTSSITLKIRNRRPWAFDEQVIDATDTDETQPVDDDLVAGSGIFKATDLIGDYAYLPDGARYGYVADIIVQDGAISALVTDAAAYGRRGYYAYPYAYRGDMNRRYELPYDPVEIDTLENSDYEQLQSRVTR